jgi:hypothetical protein
MNILHSRSFELHPFRHDVCRSGMSKETPTVPEGGDEHKASPTLFYPHTQSFLFNGAGTNKVMNNPHSYQYNGSDVSAPIHGIFPSHYPRAFDFGSAALLNPAAPLVNTTSPSMEGTTRGERICGSSDLMCIKEAIIR